MAVTVSSFLERFPEFTNVNADYPTLIQIVIDEAALQVSATVWGAKRDLGIKYLTAHLLACSPFGEPARLSPGNGETTYLKQFEMLKKQAASGFRIAGPIRTPVDPCG